MQIGEVTDNGLNPVIRGWHNLANSGVELQRVTIDDTPIEVERYGYTDPDITVSDVIVTDRREVKDTANWAHAVDPKEKQVVRMD